MQAGNSVALGRNYYSLANHGGHCLQSYQFQVGTEVSEAVTLEKSSGSLTREASMKHQHWNGLPREIFTFHWRSQRTRTGS